MPLEHREDRKDSKKYNTTILVNLNNYKYKNIEDTRIDFALTDGRILYTDTIFIVDIYLPNIISKCYNELNNLEKFLRVGIEQDIEKALEYAGDDVELMNFVIAGKEKSSDKRLLESYNKEEAYAEQSYRNGLDAGIAEGHASGLAEGHASGLAEGEIKKQKEIAKNLLSLKMPIKDISKATGLSIKEIERLE